jgi:LacI family transcriptional regulator
MIPRGQKAVTLKDIAEKTGYSINTVSHALKDKTDISEKTRELIKKVADEMGYIVNASASSLRSGVSKIIAIILGDISNPFFSILVRDIEVYLKEQGYVSFILNTNEDEEIERKAIIAALSKNVDGIMICPTPKGEKNIEFLKQRNTPFVLLGRRFAGIDANYVVWDEITGGYEVTKCLLRNGHRKIMFLSGPKQVAKERLMGYQKALAEYGVPYEESLVKSIPILMAEGRRVEKAVSDLNGATAIVAFSDMIAWEVIYCLQKRGLSVPEDVSVVGFDNIQAKYRFPVQLTTITTSRSSMAREASDILLRKLNRAEKGVEKLVLDVKLVSRESVKNISSKNKAH